MNTKVVPMEMYSNLALTFSTHNTSDIGGVKSLALWGGQKFFRILPFFHKKLCFGHA